MAVFLWVGWPACAGRGPGALIQVRREHDRSTAVAARDRNDEHGNTAEFSGKAVLRARTGLDGYGLEDLHPESLAQFRNRFASLDPSNPWLAEDERGLLIKLGAWRRDRRSGIEGLTLAGLLMFGREQAIRDPAGVPGFQLDYREHFSDDPSVRWTDRLTLDGRWEGNLFQFYQQVIVKLGTGPGIKQPFQIDAEGYRRATTSVHEALQEALVNALIHADHAGQGGIVIDRYLDHLEFSNPGTLLLSTPPRF